MHLQIIPDTEMDNSRVEIQITDLGWYISADGHSGVCDKRAAPHLYSLLNFYHIEYPIELGETLRTLWSEVHERNLDNAAIQTRLDKISEWIRTYKSLDTSTVPD